MRPADVTGLRAALEHAVRQPPFDEVLARAARLRRRRRATAGVLALGTAALVLALAQPVRRATDPPPDPEPGPSFAVNAVDFTDRQTGYAVLGPCAERNQCTLGHSLVRTDDGGRTWQRLTLPMLDPGPDATTFLLEAHGRHDVALMVNTTRYASHDGGRTWRQTDVTRPGAPVEVVPPGHTVVSICLDEPCPNPLAVMDRVDGSMRPLAHAPTFPPGTTTQFEGFAVDPDGPVWVLGTDRDERLLAARSDDRGRHWTVVPAPRVTEPFLPRILADPATPRTYFAVWARTGRIGGVWRLDDPRAGTWTEVTPDGADQMVGVRELPNGELRYADRSGRAWQTSDGGAEVDPAPKAHVDGADIDVVVADVVDGMLVGVPVVGRRGDRVLFSTDNGRHWQVRPVRP